MKNKEKWYATKFLKNANDKFKPNPHFVNPSSWFITSQYINDYVSVIHRHCSGKVLDCGCGNVPYYEIYKNQIKENYCIDWSNSPHGNLYIDKYVDLNDALPIGDEIYDSVLLIDVLEHIKIPDLLLKELFRVLKTNGKLILMVPFYYMLHEQPADYYRYTRFGLEYLLQEQGFQIEELVPYGGYFEVLGDLVNKRILNGKISAKLLVKLFFWFKKTALYKKYNRPENFPLGYILVGSKP